MKKLTHFPKPLRRGLLVLLAGLLCGTVQAEWVPLGRSDSFRAYVDPKPVQKNADSVQVWQLMDFVTAQWVDAQTVVGSIRNLVEYDCHQPRSRTLAAEAYSEQMGGGRKVANERPANPPWEGVEPGSSAAKIREIACGKS